jgi:hypothetical protein
MDATCRTWTRRAAAALVCAGAALACAPAAGAAPTSPSTASVLTAGLPYSEFIPEREYYHWLRLPQPLRNLDELQLAVDVSDGARICLAGPADDFDEQRVEEECNDAENEQGNVWGFAESGKSRQLLAWRGSPAAEYLVVKDNAGFGITYSLTIERIVERVNIALAPMRRTPRRVSVTAPAVFGDNTPARDGIPGHLEWRAVGAKPVKWTRIGDATVGAGSLALSGKLPKRVRGTKVFLRACVEQPGGDRSRCAVRKVRVTRK